MIVAALAALLWLARNPVVDRMLRRAITRSRRSMTRRQSISASRDGPAG